MNNVLSVFADTFENLVAPYSETFDRLVTYLHEESPDKSFKFSTSSPFTEIADQETLIVKDSAGRELSRVEIAGPYFRGMYEAKKRAGMAARCRAEAEKIKAAETMQRTG